jgi:hypothetical protein
VLQEQIVKHRRAVGKSNDPYVTTFAAAGICDEIRVTITGDEMRVTEMQVQQDSLAINAQQCRHYASFALIPLRVTSL